MLSSVLVAAACSSSTGPTFENSVAGTYKLQTVRGAALPVPLFSQCSMGGAAPCATCSESAASGTLTLKSNPREFSLSLVSNGTCVDPLGRSPTTANTYTISASTSWSQSGSAGISFATNNMNLSSGTLSGSTLSTSFNWLSLDPGGQPAQVTAVFVK
jgi:hypothetical protein